MFWLHLVIIRLDGSGTARTPNRDEDVTFTLPTAVLPVLAGNILSRTSMAAFRWQIYRPSTTVCQNLPFNSRSSFQRDSSAPATPTSSSAQSANPGYPNDSTNHHW